MSQDLITNIYNAFNPFDPLEAGDPAYVNCSAVRGNEDIFREIGRKVVRSNRPTYQLYTGHRGVGKSTELLRLKKFLEDKGCFVVYFGATEGDIDEHDAEYTDILLSCTRHIIEELKDYASPKPLLTWLESRWQSLKDLALSEVDFHQLSINQQIGVFTKLTANLRRIPSTRETIRKEVNLYSISLIEALNQFINEAKNTFKNQSKLVVIVDNLDRIVPIYRENGRSNHEEIFIDYNSQLTSLDCHIIYTLPISLVYSKQATELRNIYDSPQVLPMIMIKDRDDHIFQTGLDKLKEIITKRIEPFAPNIDIDSKIFASKDVRLKLCNMCGGHVREMMLLMQTSMDAIDDFPITENAVNLAINEARDTTYQNAVDQDEWLKLAQVSKLKKIINEEECRDLLFRRCLLEYRGVDSQGNHTRWHDVHPLIKDIKEFQDALKELETKNNTP